MMAGEGMRRFLDYYKQPITAKSVEYTSSGNVTGATRAVLGYAGVHAY